MAAATPAIEFAGHRIELDWGKLTAQYTDWMLKQKPEVEVLLTGLASSVQGVAIGYMLGTITPPTDPNAVKAAGPWAAGLAQGGPWAQARNLGVLMGVNAALSVAIKKARNGQEDVYSA